MHRLTILIPLFLAGCSSDWTRQAEFSSQVNSVYPQNYKSDIVALMRSYLNDPTGVRNAFVSEPSQRTFEGISRYVSCIRYDAKKGGGQYAGSKDSMVLFRAGRLDRIVDNALARDLCREAKYAPFPELQQLTR